MPETPLPPNEAQRLEALYSYQVLDSVQENEFDELVELAAQITGCPVASISFIDKDRQWFKASKNLPVQETLRKDAFCSYTILKNEPMVVEDARRDPRFKNYPDVIGGLGIGFYAGIPIHTQSGFNLGTVCVIDHKPGKLTEAQLAALKIIAKQVGSLLELRLKNILLQEYTRKTIEENEQSYQSYFANSSIPKWIYEIGSLKILQVNDAAIEKYGYTKDEFLEMTVFQFRDVNELKQIDQLVQSLNQGSSRVNFETRHRLKSGELTDVEVSISNIDYKGKKARLATMSDISDRVKMRRILDHSKELMEENASKAAHTAKVAVKDYIGKELHDNINQILASTKLFLEIATTNPEMKDDMIRISKENLLEAMQEIRLLSKSLIQGKEDFGLVKSLEDLINSYAIADQFSLEFHCNGYIEELPDDIKLTIFRIIQESLNNSAKYSRADKVELNINYTDKLQVTITDNGIGFDPSELSNGIGLNNIRNRVEFYHGIVEIESAPQKGCRVFIEIPMADATSSKVS